MVMSSCKFVSSLLQSDTKLKKFLHIIEGSPVYPVIYDSKRFVLDTGKKMELFFNKELPN